jgi:thymidylate synthase
MIKAKKFEEVYGDILWNIQLKGEDVSPRGRGTKEILGLEFEITEPRHRFITFPSRNLSLFYCIGNFLWVMSQSDDLDFIQYYNPKGDMFSDDGKKLPGAYGKRIFDIDGINQYNRCIQELKLDPDSRRAIISIHMPQHDWRGVIDTPCTSDFQLFIRNGKLHMINHMRSQSAAMVMPYDVFLMTMIQEYMANELNVELGTYKHYCGSIHYYSMELPLVNEILTEHPSDFVMYTMDKIDPTQFKRLLIFEKQLRQTAIKAKQDALSQLDFVYWNDKLCGLGFSEYWNGICKLLIVKACQYNNQFLSMESLKPPEKYMNFLF